MGMLVFGMMQSLDGYVAGVAGGPGIDGCRVANMRAGGNCRLPVFRSTVVIFTDHVRGLIDEYRLSLPPVCAWRRQAILRRCQAAPPTYRRRFRLRGCGQADVCPLLDHALPPDRCSRPRLKQGDPPRFPSVNLPTDRGSVTRLVNPAGSG